MFEIKNFGCDTKCSSTQELKQVLKERYAGHSVTLRYRKPSGLTAIKYLDVSMTGEVTESYGDKLACDLNSFEACAN